MRTFHTGGVAGLDITAGLPRVEELFEARDPQGQGRDQPHRRHRRDPPQRHRDEGQGHEHARSTTRRSPLPKGAELLAAAGDLVEANQVVARIPRRRTCPRPTSSSPVKGFLVKGDDGLVVRAEDVVEREYTIPHNAKLLVENGQEIRAGDADHRRPDQPAGVPRHPGQGRRPALPGQGSPEGLPEPGRHDQRQAHRDHRPADAPQGPHRPAGRRRPAADRADRPARLRGGRTTRSWPRAASRRRPRPCCSGVTKASLNTSSLPRRGVLPGDDPGADRGRHQRRQGPPDRPQGERDHRQADPGRDGRAGERRGPQGARAAGGPRGPRRRGDRRHAAPSTTRSSRRAGRPADEAAGLALAATIAGGGEDERVQPVPHRRRVERRPTTAADEDPSVGRRRPERPPRRRRRARAAPRSRPTARPDEGLRRTARFGGPAVRSFDTRFRAADTLRVRGLGRGPRSALRVDHPTRPSPPQEGPSRA